MSGERLPSDDRGEGCQRSSAVTRVLVLGGSGMLGSAVVDWLARDHALNVAATVRVQRYVEGGRSLLAEVEWHMLDVRECLSANVHFALGKYDWIINAIGLNKQLIHDDRATDVESAMQINALFPHWLARRAEECGARVLQVETDCVYSGKDGHYSEDAPHDPLDVYGKTKSLGEVKSNNVFHLRCSVIGPELKNHISLLGWFLSQPRGAKVTGFTNHRWNGVTSLCFARICHGIIKAELELPHLHHVVPADEMTKAEMLKEFAREYNRNDIGISFGKTAIAVDRTLSTNDKTLNRRIWEIAGFPAPQRISDMIKDMRRFDFRLGCLGPAT